jgi:raffinose/stachyose/melibiose transport system substrate-binding protein
LPRSISELTAVVEKLKAAGITPFASGSKEPWVLGFHSMNLPFATQDDPAKFIADLNSGAAKITDNQRFKEFQQFIDLYIGNAEKNQLTTDYNTQLTLVATGQAAMMHQGTWTENFIAQLGEDIQNLGLLPVPINDDPEFSNKVQSGSPFAWAVNTENGNEAEGKLFLDYLVNSDTGKRYMTEVFQWIPAYTNIPFNSGGGVMKDAAKISAENRIHPWVFYGWPVGWSDKSGETMQAYIAGKLTWDEVLAKLQADWEALVKK